MEKKFKCKDEVIYQNRVHFGDEKLIWNYGIVIYEDEGYVYLVGGLYINKKAFNILPYEGNEHLVGTDLPEDEEVKLFVTEKVMALTHNENWIYATHISVFITEDLFNVRLSNGEDIKVKKVVKFSDFNPNDMEETSRHILCVKNGKIVRYKND